MLAARAQPQVAEMPPPSGPALCTQAMVQDLISQALDKHSGWRFASAAGFRLATAHHAEEGGVWQRCKRCFKE